MTGGNVDVTRCCCVFYLVQGVARRNPRAANSCKEFVHRLARPCLVDDAVDAIYPEQRLR